MSAGVVAERRVGLRGHPVGAAEQVEVVDEGRAEIDLQRLEHARRRHAEHLRLVAVDVGAHARRAGVEEGVDAGEALLLVGLGDHRVGRVLQRAVALAVLVLDHHAEAARRADAADHRRLDDHQPRLVDVGGRLVRLGDQLVDALAIAGALLEVVEHPVGGGGAGRLRLRGAVEARQHDACP